MGWAIGTDPRRPDRRHRLRWSRLLRSSRPPQEDPARAFATTTQPVTGRRPLPAIATSFQLIKISVARPAAARAAQPPPLRDVDEERFVR